MELSAKTLISFIKCKITEWVPLIERSDDPFDFIEGSAIDLGVEKVERVLWDGKQSQTPIIGKDIRRSAPTVEINPTLLTDAYLKDFDLSSEDRAKLVGKQGWYLSAGDYLLQSKEWINCYDNLRGDVDGRRTYFMSACLLGVTKIAPGYKGTITCLLHVFYGGGLLLEKGVGFVTSTFAEMDSRDTHPHKQRCWDGENTGTDGVKPGR